MADAGGKPAAGDAGLAFLNGDGDCARLIASRDWLTTPLGPIAEWSQPLKTATALLLRSPVPMVMLWGEDGVMLYNDAYAVFAGGRHPELLGAKVREGWPEVADFNDNVMKVGFAGGTLSYRDQELTLYRHGAPEQVWMNLDYSPVLDDVGQPAGVLCVLSETTGRVRADAALRESEERLRLAAEAAHIGTWDLDMTTGQGRWDRTAFEIGGLGAEGRTPFYDAANWADLVHDEDRERVAAAFAASLARGGPPYDVEFRGAVPALDGGARYLASHGAVLCDEAGDPFRATGIVRDITRERRAVEALQTSEARFRSLVDAVPSFVWFARPDGELEYFNDRWFAYTGQTWDEALPNGWADVLHPDEAADIAREWQDARAAGTSYEVECRYRRSDGAYRWFVARAEPVRENGEIVRWFGTSTDIHEQKEAAQRVQLALDAGAILGLWVWDVKDDRVRADHRFARAFDLDPDEARMGVPLEQVLPSIHEDDRERVAAVIQDALEKRGSYRCEYRVRHAAGDYRWIEATGNVETDANGEPLRFPGILVDIHERRAAEAERDQLVNLLQAFVEAVPGAVYAKDTEGRVLVGNAGFAAATGHGPEDYLGRTDAEFLTNKADAERIMANDRLVLETGRTQQVEEEIVLPDGRLSYWISTKSPFRDGDGNVIGLVGSSVEITERREAEERERLLAREVDHRAKNLLGVVQSVVQLTRSSDIQAFKEAVTGRIQALARAHSLLAAARWEGVELSQLVEEELLPFARAGTDRVKMSGPALRLRPGASQAIAMALHELATNAAKYGALSSDTGLVAVNWALAEDEAERRLELTWAEEGGPAVAAPTRKGFGSTVITSSIERQLSGSVDKDWREDGLRVRIVVPADQLADGAPVRTDVRPTVATTPQQVSMAGRRVLIVEDEALISLQIEQAVEQIGCTVVGPATSVAAALDLLRTQAPDAAILDVNLAGERSERVAQALSALGIPFIYCTGYADTGEASALGGSAGRLSKPLDPAQLRHALEGLFRKPQE